MAGLIVLKPDVDWSASGGLPCFFCSPDFCQGPGEMHRIGISPGSQCQMEEQGAASHPRDGTTGAGPGQDSLPLAQCGLVGLA